MVAQDALGELLPVPPSGQPFPEKLHDKRLEGVLSGGVRFKRFPDQRGGHGVDLDLTLRVPVAQRRPARPLSPRQLFLDPLLDLFGEIVDVVRGKDDVDPENHLPLGVVGIGAGHEEELHPRFHQVVHLRPVPDVAQQSIRLVAEDADRKLSALELSDLLEHRFKEGPSGLLRRVRLPDDLAD